MKLGLFLAGLFAVLSLNACGGGGEKPSTQSQAAVQKQVDEAKATLQSKADALARQASASPQPEKEPKK